MSEDMSVTLMPTVLQDTRPSYHQQTPAFAQLFVISAVLVVVHECFDIKIVNTANNVAITLAARWPKFE